MLLFWSFGQKRDYTIPECLTQSKQSKCTEYMKHQIYLLILIQFTEILKKQKDTPQPGESTSQEEHSAVVSSDLPCASDNKNTGKSRCLNWRWVVAKGDVSMAEGPAEHFYLQTHR